jgi:uncharacterized membrane protein
MWANFISHRPKGDISQFSQGNYFTFGASRIFHLKKYLIYDIITAERRCYMNKLLNFIGNILYIGMIIFDVIEFLALPALFLIIGLMNSFPWQYYAITIGGYFALFIVLEIILHFIFKALDKKYTPLIERKLEKYLNKFSNKG